MTLWQSIKMALRNLRTNKLRSSLTMLGVIIGVTSIISLVSIGQGATGSITSQVESLGANQVTVSITDPETDLTYQDVGQWSLEERSDVSAVSATLTAAGNLRTGNESQNYSITGADEAYTTIQGMNVLFGRNLSAAEVESRENVALIGEDTAEELFDAVNVVGQSIQVEGVSMTIIGVVDEGQGFMSTDKPVIIPVTTAERLLPQAKVSSVSVTAASTDQVTGLERAIRTVVLESTGDEDSFSIINQQALLETVDMISGVLTMAIGFIAGISLVVGGIGIMNIMLVSVSERTKEIGIQKAIGARNKDIMTQFLIESVVVTLISGIIGVLVGLGISALGAVALGVPFTISVTLIVIAVVFSMSIGIIFGLMPARKAARLQPIDALRTE